ncbi:hypothetical protein J6590_057645 [Homalodisca vitripennis]|nr:hypothetical protein J6590_057645 [Homalodisca vitripennis]
MDSFTNTDADENVSNLTKQCFDSKPETKKVSSLSNLTAKYNKTRNTVGSFSNVNSLKYVVEKDGSNQDTIRHEPRTPSNKYLKQTKCLELKPLYPSSSEEDSSDSEFSGLSLAGLAAKHKIDSIQKFEDLSDKKMTDLKDDFNVMTLTGGSRNHHYTLDSPSELCYRLATEIRLRTDTMNETTELKTDSTCRILNQVLYKPTSSSNIEGVTSSYIKTNFQEDSDSDESISLAGLVLKHAKNVSQPKTGSVDDMSENTSTHLAGCCPMRQYTKSESDGTSKIFQKVSKPTSESNTEIVTSSYVTMNFQDDSDSDESISLAGLVLKHTKSISQSETGSTDDMSQNVSIPPIPAGSCLLRQHTKSESDRFTPSILTSEMLMKRGFENEMSTSLGSLGVSSRPDSSDFQFYQGYSLPGSYRKKNKDCHLASSLGSIRVAKSGLDSMNSFSDPNVSVKHNSKPVSKHTLNLNIPYVINTDPEVTVAHYGGINLSSAIKSSSNTTVNESVGSEGYLDVSSEPETDDIVTLLDAESTLVKEEVMSSLLHSLITDKDTVDSYNGTKRVTSVVGKMEDSCIFDASHILKLKLKLRTTKCSSFGKVICKKWRLSQMPYIKREKFQTTVLPFDFLTPSPDDELASLRRRRNFLT